MFSGEVMNYSIVYLVVGSIIVALVSNITNMYMIDSHKMKALKHKAEKLQRKMKEKRKEMSNEDLKKLMDEQYSLMSEQMKYSLKASLVSGIIIIPALYLIKKWVGEATYLLPYYIPFVGTTAGWITLYLLYVILFSILIKKILNLTY